MTAAAVATKGKANSGHATSRAYTQPPPPAPLPSTWLDYHLYLLLPSAALLHVYLSPYTKVEESFNVQALHDWLFFGPARLDEFDHLVFSGAVPRSFVPSVLLSAVAYMPLLALKTLGYVRTSADVQFYLRCVLALLWSSSLLFFIRRITASLRIPLILGGHEPRVRRIVRRCLVAISALQFHLPFWASRTTPNSLAMPGVLLALALILPRGLAHEHSQLAGVALLTSLGVIVRLELLGLLGAAGLYLVHSRIAGWRHDTDPHPFESVARLAGAAQASLTLSAAVSASVDSFMWRTEGWILPEVEAVRFNVVEGRSAEWGVSPWHEYLSSSLPKLLSFALPLVLLGCLIAVLGGSDRNSIQQPQRQQQQQPRTGQWKRIDNEQAARDEGTTPLVALMFLPVVQVALLSCLGHKEWRFISYVVPLLNVAGAVGASLFFCPASFRGAASLPPVLRRLAAVVPLGLLALTAGTTLVSTLASTLNYPGGEALAALHGAVRPDADVNVHIDVLPAMTGVTLFQSVHLARPQRGAFGVALLPDVLPSSPSQQKHMPWRYDKTEDLPPPLEDADVATWTKFTHLLSDAPGCRIPPSGLGVAGQDLFAPLRTAPPTSEFAGLYLRARPTLHTAEWERALSLGGLMSIRLFSAPLQQAGAEAEAGAAEKPRERVLGVALGLGTRAVTLGLKTREVVWVCERVGGQ